MNISIKPEIPMNPIETPMTSTQAKDFRGLEPRKSPEAMSMYTVIPSNNTEDLGFDARAWAAEFVKIFPECDYETMITWFASALMTGYDYAKSDK